MSQVKCKLCESEFKTEAALQLHLERKTACVSSQTVVAMLNKNADELNEQKELKERLVTIQEQSDFFRQLHVRSQKQLQAWRKEHQKCSVTIAKLPPQEEYTGPRQTMSVTEFFDNLENNPEANDILLPEGAREQARAERAAAAAEKAKRELDGEEVSPQKEKDKYELDTSEGSPVTTKGNRTETKKPERPERPAATKETKESEIKGTGNGTTSDPFKFSNSSSDGNSFSFGNTSGDSNFSFKQPTALKDPDLISTPTNWSSWTSRTNNNPKTVSTSWSSADNNTTTTSTTNGNSIPYTTPQQPPAFGTPEWTKQFTQNAPWNKKNQLAKMANGQITDTTNMTTTNTTTTNITNNIVNINVKLCAPGFESLHITDSRVLSFSMEKKQRIADHLQKLVEIMMDEPVPKYNT